MRSQGPGIELITRQFNPLHKLTHYFIKIYLDMANKRSGGTEKYSSMGFLVIRFLILDTYLKSEHFWKTHVISITHVNI